MLAVRGAWVVVPSSPVLGAALVVASGSALASPLGLCRVNSTVSPPPGGYERRPSRSRRRHEALDAVHAQHPVLSERRRPQFAVVTPPLVERQRPLGVVVHTRRVVHHRRVSENGTFNRQIKRFTYSASLPSANEVAVR